MLYLPVPDKAQQENHDYYLENICRSNVRSACSQELRDLNKRLFCRSISYKLKLCSNMRLILSQ